MSELGRFGRRKQELDMLQKIRNARIRNCLGLFWSTPIPAILSEASMLPIGLTLELATVKCLVNGYRTKLMNPYQNPTVNVVYTKYQDVLSKVKSNLYRH